MAIMLYLQGMYSTKFQILFEFTELDPNSPYPAYQHHNSYRFNLHRKFHNFPVFSWKLFHIISDGSKKDFAELIHFSFMTSLMPFGCYPTWESSSHKLWKRWERIRSDAVRDKRCVMSVLSYVSLSTNDKNENWSGKSFSGQSCKDLWRFAILWMRLPWPQLLRMLALRNILIYWQLQIDFKYERFKRYSHKFSQKSHLQPPHPIESRFIVEDSFKFKDFQRPIKLSRKMNLHDGTM